MEPTWVLSAPDGPHVGPMNLAIGVGRKLTYEVPLSWGLVVTRIYHIRLRGQVDFATIVCPGAELDDALLVIKREPLDVYTARANVQS